MKIFAFLRIDRVIITLHSKRPTIFFSLTVLQSTYFPNTLSLSLWFVWSYYSSFQTPTKKANISIMSCLARTRFPTPRTCMLLLLLAGRIVSPTGPEWRKHGQSYESSQPCGTTTTAHIQLNGCMCLRSVFWGRARRSLLLHDTATKRTRKGGRR